MKTINATQQTTH